MTQVALLIVAIIVNVSLALVILTRVRTAVSTAYFAVSSLFVVLWAIGTLLLLYGDTTDVVQAGLILFIFAPMMTTVYMVLFAKHFAGIKAPSRAISVGFFIAIMIIVGSFVIPGINSTAILLSVDSGEISNTVDFQRSWYIVYGAYFVLMFSIAYGYLLTGLLRRKGKLVQQLRFVSIGIFATSFISLITNVIFPLLGETSLLWIGAVSTLLYVVTTTYAMIRHGLFDIRLALVLTFTYGLSLLVLAGVYYAGIYTVSALFVNSNVAAGFNVFDVTLALLLAFLFQPIRRFFDKVTSKIFYQGSYSTDEFYASLSTSLTSTTELTQLLRRASITVATTLKAVSASFTVFADESTIIYGGSGNYSKLPKADLFHLIEHAKKAKGTLYISAQLRDTDTYLYRLMVSHQIAVILPLRHQGELIGFFALGEHFRQQYTIRDFNVLESVANEIIIAVQNALSLQKVKILNEHLEHRIDTATKELRASNAQLQHLDEVKDEFISMASHQLRTPLTSIKGYVSMLLEGDVGPLSKEQERMLLEAFNSSERMVRLIGDFLNVSRLQTGKFVLDRHSTDLTSIVQQELSALEQSAQTRGHTFQFTAAKSPLMVELDENKMQQVIMNFADNALYYSKNPSKIKVNLKQVGDWIEFTIKDTGIGVPKDQQEQLFTKFFRASNARQQRPDGTGIGLFLAKKVIDAHHGEVIFSSTEGKGSTFGFRLPVQKPTR